jgi:hypothetical protein
MALVCGLAAASVAQPLTRLYGARPPAGSSYVRVVNPAAQAASIVIAGGPPATISSAGTIATTYRIVPGGKPIAVTIDGKPPKAALDAAAGTFVTLVVTRRAGSIDLVPIADESGDVDGLRAQLRFYNLVPGCTAALTLESGTAVFDGVAFDDSKSRTINPVTATLVPHCGATAGTSVRLPQLKSGDRYSLFLVGEAAHPGLAGNLDATEPYKGS